VLVKNKYELLEILELFEERTKADLVARNYDLTFINPLIRLIENIMRLDNFDIIASIDGNVGSIQDALLHYNHMALHYEVRMLWRITSDESEFLELPDLFYPSDDEDGDEEMDEVLGWTDSGYTTDEEEYDYDTTHEHYNEYVLAGALAFAWPSH
jgi:hypothetical protein